VRGRRKSASHGQSATYTARMPLQQKSNLGSQFALTRSRALALLLLPTVLVLSPVLFADFIRLDDYSHLFDNPHLHRMSVSGLAAFWTKSYFNLYIPITYSVWWALTMIGSQFCDLRQNAWIFHALNLAIHLANVTLFFFLVRALIGIGRQKAVSETDRSDNTVALTSALLFALHPVQVESVAWVSELKGELAAMFGLLGLWWHYRPAKRWLAAACFAAAVLSKPSSIVFPGIVLLVNRILLGWSVRKSAAVPFLYGLPLLVVAFVTKRLQPDSNLDFVPTAAQKLAVAADAFAFYVFKVLVPYPHAVDYGRSPQFVLNHVPGWQVALSGLLLVAGVAIVAFALIRPKPSSPIGGWYSLVSCGWSIFILSITPVLGLIPFGFQEFSTVANHYLYVPLMGISVMVAGILVRVGTFARSQLVVAALLLVCAGLSTQQAYLWRSTETLFANTVAVNPRSYLACYCIADEHVRAGRFVEGLEWHMKSHALNPDYLNGQVGLGMALVLAGEPARAIEHYSAALAKNPSIVGTRAKLVSSLHNNLGMLLLQTGRQAEGVDHFRKAVEIFPRSVNGHLNLGNVAFAERRYLDAIAEFEIAESLSPRNPAVEQRLANARRSAQHASSDDRTGR
jgi:protein O-mannosyl-transferase